MILLLYRIENDFVSLIILQKYLVQTLSQILKVLTRIFLQTPYFITYSTLNVIHTVKMPEKKKKLLISLK